MDQGTASNDRAGFLPFETSKEDEARYLSQVVEQGGAAAQDYKALSYDLLQIEQGMRILDVGCGIGLDLPALADRVGKAGLVVGLDHDSSHLQKAREATAGRDNVQVVAAEAQKIPFPDHSFDRVRTDRVLQHIPDLGLVLAEMWRVLRPGGLLTIIEPDWKMIALFPGSPAGGDQDHTWSAIVALCQRRLPHALMGRQIAAFLQQQGTGCWAEIQLQVVAYLLTSWSAAEGVLQLSNLAEALIKEAPTRTDEINAWLQAIRAAAARGEFLACVPLYFARARKVGNK
jgi:ubiquinone/menaquinone biosynthesis C-methylase UbiE